MLNQYVVEVCTVSVQSAVNAELAGAKRVELCENLTIGGTTPSFGLIKTTRKKISIKLNVLIRPRGGDFLYSDLEFDQTKEDILVSKELGVDGIVCGILLPNGKVDIERTKELVELSKPLNFTFHRAFDLTIEPYKALEDVIKTGATHLLTSGQKPKAVDAIETISNLVKLANNRITIMPGSGINGATIEKLIKTGAKEFHMSGTAEIESKMKFRRPNLKLTGVPPSDYTIVESKKESIQLVVDYLNSK